MNARWHVTRRGALAALGALVMAACEHPIAVVTPHIEAADAILRTVEGVELARTVENRSWRGGPITLRDGHTASFIVTFIDFQGAEFSIADRADLSVRMEAEDEALLAWEPRNGFGRLIPFGHGTTRVRFLAWHQTHADFITPWIEVTIQPQTTADPTALSLFVRSLR